MIKCPNCGADIHFVPETQNYVCDYCGSAFTQEELNEAQKQGEIKAEEQVTYEEKDEAASSADTGAAKDKGEAAAKEAKAEKKKAQDESSDYMRVIIYTCPQCGGELLTTEETAATFCSYCGASVVLEKRVSDEMKPDYIIPFQITKEQAADIYKKKMSKAIFAPSYMRHMDIEKIRGIYMPYWTYSVLGNAQVSAKKTENIPAPGGMMVNEYSVSASISMSGNGIEFDSASAFPDDLSQSIAPFDFKEAKPFAASYMSGFYADAGDVPMETYLEDAGNVMRVLAADKAADEMGVGAGEVLADIPDPTANGERAMYPVWFVSARNKVSNKVSYAVINGQSGKMAADIPVDNRKLIIGMLCLAVPIFAILYFLITPTPVISAWVVLALSALGCIFAVSNMSKRSSGVNGKSRSKVSGVGIGTIVFGAVIASLCGFLWLPDGDTMFLFGALFGAALLVYGIITVVKQAKRASTGSKVKTGVTEASKKVYALPFVLSILSVVVCLVAVIWHPINDLIMYIMIIIAGVLSGISYWTMFSIYNRGMLRKLPQLGKRGGDE